MKYKEITYKRIVNLGNYENETIELTAEIDIDSDDRQEIQKCITKVRNEAYHALLYKIEDLQDNDEIPFD